MNKNKAPGVDELHQAFRQGLFTKAAQMFAEHQAAKPLWHDQAPWLAVLLQHQMARENPAGLLARLELFLSHAPSLATVQPEHFSTLLELHSIRILLLAEQGSLSFAERHIKTLQEHSAPASNPSSSLSPKSQFEIQWLLARLLHQRGMVQAAQAAYLPLTLKKNSPLGKQAEGFLLCEALQVSVVMANKPEANRILKKLRLFPRSSQSAALTSSIALAEARHSFSFSKKDTARLCKKAFLSSSGLDFISIECREKSAEMLAAHLQADEHFAELLALRRETLEHIHNVDGCHSRSCFRAHTFLGLDLVRTGDFPAALATLQIAENIAETFPKDEQILHAESLLNLATVALQTQVAPEKITPWLHVALDLFVEEFGEECEEVAFACTLLGVCYYALQKYEQARSLFEASTLVRERREPEECDQITPLLGVLACDVALQKKQNVEQGFVKALQVGAHYPNAHWRGEFDALKQKWQKF